MARDAGELAKMYERLEGPLFRKCRSMLDDDELARDAAQEVFIKLSHAIDELRSEEAELAWALKAAHNHCLNALRGERRREAREGVAHEAEPVAHSPVTNRQLGERVLAHLSKTSRALVVGTVIDGEEQQTLASKHGVSTKTVARKVKRAIDEARQLLKRRGGG